MLNNRRSATEYNSLSDVHLQAYFSNRNLLRHLRKAGLINKKLEIVPEATYRANINRAEQKKEVKEALAQAIVHKSLDLQLKRESEIQKRLEEIAKLELVKKIRSERLQRKSQMSPSSRSAMSQHPAWKYFTLFPNKQESFLTSRPRTDNRSRQNIRDSTSVTSVETTSYIDSFSESTSTSVRDSELHLKHARGDASTRSHCKKPDKSPPKKSGLNLAKYDEEKVKGSPYLYPVPGMEKKTLRIFENPTVIRKNYYPPESMANKRTNCLVTFQYLGTNTNICWEEPSLGTEVIIQQQHCGGNTLCVYRGHLHTREEFSFVSHRHLNFPFSLSIYLAGMLYLRVSACCEYRHRKGTRLGGPQGLFTLVNVQGASPCARCQLSRQMNEERKKPKVKSENRRTESDPRKVESSLSVLVESPSSSKQESKSTDDNIEDRKNNTNDQNNTLKHPDDQEGRHTPLVFTVSGTVINVEESNSDEEQDYEDDFEDEGEENTEMKSVGKEEEAEEEKEKEEKVEEIVEEEKAALEEEEEAKDEDSSETFESSESEESFLSEKEEDKKTEEMTEGKEEQEKKEEKDEEEEEKKEKEEKTVKVEPQKENGDGISSSESEENEPLKENLTDDLKSLEKKGTEKDGMSTSPEGDTGNEEKEKKGNESPKNKVMKKAKQLSTGSSPLPETVPGPGTTPTSDSEELSDSSSSKESGGSPPLLAPTVSRRKSKIKAEKRVRADNRPNAPSSSSDTDSVAHLPPDLEGTEKAKNWIPARQQETI